MTGYIVFAHGSSVESANEAVRQTAREMARRGNLERVVVAFLEGGEPDLHSAARLLAESGARRLIAQMRRAQPDVQLEVTAPLDGHPALVDALLERAQRR